MKWESFWHERTAQERTWLIIGTIVIVLGLFYHSIWKPLSNEATQLQKANEQKSQLYHWMEDHQDEAKANLGKPSNQKPLFALAQKYFKKLDSDKPPTINRVNQNSVTVSFEGIGFDTFIKRLESFTSKENIHVEQLVARQMDGEGLVTVTCTLTK